MAIRPIRIAGDPVLHQRAQEVGDVNEDVHLLLADMVDTMRAAPGVGLAAPQIGVPLQVFVWEWQDGDTLYEGAVINPSLDILSRPQRNEEEDDDLEGCLSVPDERFPLARADRVRLTGTTPEGGTLDIEASGWLARIFQHEFDHLQGTLYVDRLPFRLKRQAKKAIRQNGWGTPGHSWTPGIDDFEGSGENSEET